MKQAGHTVLNVAEKATISNPKFVDAVLRGDITAASRAAKAGATKEAVAEVKRAARKRKQKKQSQGSNASQMIASMPVSTMASKTEPVPNAMATTLMVQTAKTSNLANGNGIQYVATLQTKQLFFGEADFYFNDYGVFEFRLCPLQADLYPMLASVAQNFRNFRFTKLVMDFIPAVPTTTPGQMAIIYLGDATDLPPPSWQASGNTTKALQGNIYSRLSYGLDVGTLMNKAKDSLAVQLPPYRDSNAYGEDQLALIRQTVQGTIMVGITGLPVGFTSSLGSFLVSVVCEFYESNVPSIDLQLAVTPVLDVDLNLTVGDTFLSYLTRRPRAFWRTSRTNPLRAYFTGSPTSMKFTVNYTTDGVAPLPSSIWQVFTYDGVPILATSVVLETTGTTSLGQSNMAAIAVYPMSNGSYVQFYPSAGKIEIESDVVGQALNSRY